MSVFLGNNITKNRIGFIHIPKTAGTSIREWLINVYGPNNCEHLEHCPLLSVPKKYLADTLFAVVRNPYSRALSVYFYSYKLLTHNGPASRAIQPQLPFTKEDLDKGFEHFCNNFFHFSVRVSHIDISPADSMASYIKHSHKNIDYILKFENLDKEFRVIQNLVGNYTQLQHLNTSKNHNLNYKNYYTTKSKQVVERYYAEDLELFKYVF